MLLTPPPLPKGILFSPQFRSHQEISRDQGDGPLELNDRHLRSQGKIRGCEQSLRIPGAKIHRPLPSPRTKNRFCPHETEVRFKKWRFPMPCAVNIS